MVDRGVYVEDAAGGRKKPGEGREASRKGNGQGEFLVLPLTAYFIRPSVRPFALPVETVHARVRLDKGALAARLCSVFDALSAFAPLPPSPFNIPPYLYAYSCICTHIRTHRTSGINVL